MNNQDSGAVGFLITGDEVIAGDILDRNSYEIARLLGAQGVRLGARITVQDEHDLMVDALKFLLARHDVLISTGGLGPTSDDITRYAIADTLGLELVHDESTWCYLKARAKRLERPLPDCNRQQVLFPKGARIIENELGTAAGCIVTHHGKTIVMLPGPPRECLPMIGSAVLPTLKEMGMWNQLYRKSWMLTTIGEGQLQSELNKLELPKECKVGFRYAPPEIEFKLVSASKEVLADAEAIVLPLIREYMTEA